MPRSPNADMRSPTDEACRFEDEYHPMTQAESDANWAAFKAGTLCPEYRAFPSRRGLNDTFKREAA